MKRKKFNSGILLNNDTSYKKEKTHETCFLAQKFLLKLYGNLNESVIKCNNCRYGRLVDGLDSQIRYVRVSLTRSILNLFNTTWCSWRSRFLITGSLLKKFFVDFKCIRGCRVLLELKIFVEKILNILTRHFCKFCFVKSMVDPCFAVLCANSLPGMHNRNIVQVLITLFNYF